MRQPNARSSHVVADEITWEQYVFEKCPCRPVERRFSETRCSQVGVFEATWEHYVPDNQPYRPLQGRFRKIYHSQVFCPPLTCGLCESCGDGFRRCHDRRRTTSGTAAGIYDLRRLKIKHCVESVGEARSALDFCLSITQNIQVTQNRSRGSKRESRHGNCRHLL